MKNLKSNSILSYLTFKQNNNSLSILSEYPGPCFGNLINTQYFKLPIKKQYLLAFLYQIFKSIHYLHKNNIIHRDLRPQNIFISSSTGKPILGGLFLNCKIIKNKATSLLGCSDYLSPEMLKGEGYSNKVDIWGFGVLSYYLVYGEMPFSGKSEYQTIVNICDNKYNITFNELPEFKRLKDIIKQCLVRDEEKRATSTDIKLLFKKYFKNDIKLSLSNLINIEEDNDNFIDNNYNNEDNIDIEFNN